jgi:hypothetical protein
MPAALPTRIRKLYKKGWSEKAIASELCTQPSTVIRLLNKNKYSNRSIGYIKSCERKRKRFMNLDTIKISKINKTQARLYAAILYWCEGSKYPASTALNFTTTDVKMQKLFLAFFRKGFNPTESKFRVWLQYHSGQDKQTLFKYWATNLRIPTSQFMKPSITDKKGGRYRKVYRGTCSLRYADYSMILRLMGIYQRFYKRAFSILV